MKKIISMMVFIAIALAVRADSITLVDETDLSPIAGATVISDNGLIIGQTDKKGEINVSRKDFPLSIRCLGYEALTITESTDTIRMSQATYALGELLVMPIERPITRVLMYVRKYSYGTVGNDTTMIYEEAMLEYLFAKQKVKGYDKADKKAKTRNTRTYGRKTSHGKDSIYRPKASNHNDIIVNPHKEIEVTKAIRQGASSDTIQGKYSPKYIYKSNKDIVVIDYDPMGNKKEHKVSPSFAKMLGIKTDIHEFSETVAFKKNKRGKYGIQDYIYGNYNINISYSGPLTQKVFKTKDGLEFQIYGEQYPVLIESLSVEEYKELKESRNDTQIEFMIPELVQPLAPAVQRLVDRFEPEGRSVDEQRNIKGI